MKLVLLFNVIAVSVSAQLELQEEWQFWKNEHGKRYESAEEECTRQAVWLTNMKYIQQHNTKAEDFGYSLAMNHLGDKTLQEFQKSFSCYKTGNYTSGHKVYVPSKYQELPDSVDWRTKNAVTPVKNQGQCGACYAFSATGALEGAHALAHNKLLSLSEQNLVDCSVPYGNDGCNGGTMHRAFEYVIDNSGIDTEMSYPYKGKQSQCKFLKVGVGATEAGIVMIPRGSEEDLKAATATAGPVSVAVDGSSNAFRFYSGGVFDEPNCSATELTHALLIIGYGTYKEKDYWLVKNSWGTDWGLNGFAMMRRNSSNQCGIATDASFPTL